MKLTDEELIDGMTYQFSKCERETGVIKNAIRDSGTSPELFCSTYEGKIKEVWRNIATEIMDANGYVTIDIAGYKEIVPFIGEESKKPRQGFIYIITDGVAVKIGQAANVEKRIAGHQVSNPRKLTLLQSIEVDDMDRAEKSVQHWYRKFWVRGEWFDLLPLFGLDRNDYIETMLGMRDVRHDYTYQINLVNGIDKEQYGKVWIRRAVAE